ncbi:PadR family transcriptional regulator [Thermococcus peptonophilus]|uniref:PadR family transcriptional regulator n=1 Tax=Thermococcus peptonophilus TaxID=53952 RepID=A0A142CV44_9EURY|nr:PadR family transcriptional regulator [Thermococcus peptonophilus]AMQ18646.1 PadR family transcriptional regulator [Thermococcus peptonophilus]
MSDSLVRNMFTVPMRNLILLIIGLKGETHGYEILKEIEKVSRGSWKPSHGNLYTMLNKMVEEGLIEPREEYHGKRKLVKYTLTEKGWNYLKEANELALQSLYIAVQYHEMLREKLKQMGYGKDIAVEAIDGYVELLDRVISILEAKKKSLLELKEKAEKGREKKSVTGTGS